ncbi:MAG: DUF192 domain-containing protein [Candidatus Binataceae bacterium]
MTRAINRTRGTVLCAQLEEAQGYSGRSRGLLGRERLLPHHGMRFIRSRLEPFMWMHMFFMRFPIDLVFLGHDDRVIKINPGLKPWRLSSIVIGATQALELAAGAVARSGTAVGDRIVIEPISLD